MKWLFLLPLLAFSLTARAGAYPTVVIDPGHGGHDRGGIPGQRACEKALALDVGKRLSEIMKENGVKTVLTRSDDTFIPLARRVAIGNAHPDALFVSIHFNSALRRGANGFETYYYNPKGGRVAVRVESELAKVRHGENRGVKRRPYYVLRKTRIPSVLVECGFLTNPGEAALCSKPEYRQSLARAIARGIRAAN